MKMAEKWLKLATLDRKKKGFYNKNKLSLLRIWLKN